MDYTVIARFFRFAAFILAALFAVNLVVDLIRYNTTLNSAPFYVWILADAAGFLLPAIVCFMAGRYLKKRSKTTR